MYWIDYRMPNGKQRRESLAQIEGCDPYSIKDARDAYSKRTVQKREKRLFDALPEETMTFSELCDWYLELDDIKDKPGLYTIEGIVKQIQASLGHIVLADLKKSQIDGHVTKLKKKGRAASTIDKQIIYLKAILKEAFFNDIISGRTLKAATAVKQVGKKGQNARDRVLSIAEYKKLLDEAKSHCRAYIEAAMLTGCRLGELKKWRWDMVDRKAGMLRLPPDITKTNKGRSIPITGPLETLLDSLPRSLSGYILCYKGARVRGARGTYRSFGKACEDAGVAYGRDVPGGLVFHDIRRTVKTNMTTAGLPGAYRNSLLGHAQAGMDVHYFKPKEADLAKMMKKYTDWLETELENVDQTVDQNNEKESAIGDR